MAIMYQGGIIAQLFLVTLLCWGAGARRPHTRRTRPFLDVPTTVGWVRGYLHSPPPHYAFLGIPYASPPALANRFQVPKPPVTWDGLFEAVHRVKCMQPSGIGSENCLVVNVFAPANASALPVLVHVHGGGFQTGWGSFQPPLRLLARKIIIVTFNYRLGIFGFLNLGIREAPGNMGLIDQVAMLYWVRKNIIFFGGNPHNITFYGTGSGAMAVELLLLSGYTKDLFHRAILESGSALSPSALSYDSFGMAQAAAIEIGYKGFRTGRKMIKHFRRVAAKRLVNTSVKFIPCLEDDSHYKTGFLDRDPLHILKDGRYQHVPMIVAYTSSGGTTLPAERFYELSHRSKAFEKFLPNNLEFPNNLAKTKLVGYLREFYIEQTGLKNNAFQIYIEFMNDVHTQYPAVKCAAMHALKTSPPVYLMEVPYRGGYSNTDVIGKVTNAEHFDIYHIVFSNDILNDADEVMATKLITLWNNFIVYGDPSPMVDNSVEEVWQPLMTRNLNDDTDMNSVLCLSLGPRVAMRQPRASARLVFWDHVYKKFYKSHFKRSIQF